MSTKSSKSLISFAVALIAGFIVVPAAYCDPTAASLSATSEASLSASSEAGLEAGSQAQYSASSEATVESGFPAIFTGNNGSYTLPTQVQIDARNARIAAARDEVIQTHVPEIQVVNYSWPVEHTVAQSQAVRTIAHHHGAKIN